MELAMKPIDFYCDECEQIKQPIVCFVHLTTGLMIVETKLCLDCLRAAVALADTHTPAPRTITVREAYDNMVPFGDNPTYKWNLLTVTGIVQEPVELNWFMLYLDVTTPCMLRGDTVLTIVDSEAAHD